MGIKRVWVRVLNSECRSGFEQTCRSPLGALVSSSVRQPRCQEQTCGPEAPRPAWAPRRRPRGPALLPALAGPRPTLRLLGSPRPDAARPYPPRASPSSGGAVAYLGYCVHYDLKRRGDPAFRRRLRGSECDGGGAAGPRRAWHTGRGRAAGAVAVAESPRGARWCREGPNQHVPRCVCRKKSPAAKG